MRLMWYTRLVTRGGFRIWGTALGVAISVGAADGARRLPRP